MPYSDYLKTRALFFRSHGVSPGVVVKKLKEEGLHASRQGLAKFFRRYDETSSTARRQGSGRLSKLTPDVMQIVEEQMQRDDETTAVQLMCLLAAHHRPLSLSTILRCRQKLGWTFRGSAYCQLIRAANKAKRLEFARDFLHEVATGFSDVVYTDETYIVMQCSDCDHTCTCTTCMYTLPCSVVCCCRVFSHAMLVYAGTPDGIVVIIHVFMCDERKKQARSNKQGKATQHTQHVLIYYPVLGTVDVVGH